MSGIQQQGGSHRHDRVPGTSKVKIAVGWHLAVNTWIVGADTTLWNMEDDHKLSQPARFIRLDASAYITTRARGFLTQRRKGHTVCVFEDSG